MDKKFVFQQMDVRKCLLISLYDIFNICNVVNTLLEISFANASSLLRDVFN